MCLQLVCSRFLCVHYSFFSWFVSPLPPRSRWRVKLCYSWVPQKVCLYIQLLQFRICLSRFLYYSIWFKCSQNLCWYDCSYNLGCSYCVFNCFFNYWSSSLSPSFIAILTIWAAPRSCSWSLCYVSSTYGSSFSQRCS